MKKDPLRSICNLDIPCNMITDVIINGHSIGSSELPWKKVVITLSPHNLPEIVITRLPQLEF